VIRIFSKLREMLLTQKDILIKLEQLEKQVVMSNDDIQAIFNVLKQLLIQPEPPREPVGFMMAPLLDD